MKKITDSMQKRNETNIRVAFQALNNSISTTTNIFINNDSGDSHSFENVNIVLNIGKKSSIKIECLDEDKKRFESLGLKENYSADKSEFDYEVHSDKQMSNKDLIVKPLDSDRIIYIRL